MTNRQRWKYFLNNRECKIVTLGGIVALAACVAEEPPPQRDPRGSNSDVWEGSGDEGESSGSSGAPVFGDEGDWHGDKGEAGSSGGICHADVELHTPFWDVDDDGVSGFVEGATGLAEYPDGVMLLTYLHGFPEQNWYAICDGVLSDEATLDCEEVRTYLGQLEDAGLLDLDLDGEQTALGDGLMLMRYMSPFDEGPDSLCFMALSEESQRSCEEVFDYLECLGGGTVGCPEPLSDLNAGLMLCDLPSESSCPQLSVVSSGAGGGEIIELSGVQLSIEESDGELQLSVQGADLLSTDVECNGGVVSIHSAVDGHGPLRGELSIPCVSGQIQSFEVRDEFGEVRWEHAQCEAGTGRARLRVDGFGDYILQGTSFPGCEECGAFDPTELCEVVSTWPRAAQCQSGPNPGCEGRRLRIAEEHADIGPEGGVVGVGPSFLAVPAGALPETVELHFIEFCDGTFAVERVGETGGGAGFLAPVELTLPCEPSGPTVVEVLNAGDWQTRIASCEDGFVSVELTGEGRIGVVGAPDLLPVDGAGGTFTTGGGVSVTVPAGAVDSATILMISETSTASLARLSRAPVGPAQMVLPHGTEFAHPVEVRVPAPGCHAGDTFVATLEDEVDPEWDYIPAICEDGVARFETSHFSIFRPISFDAAVACPATCVEATMSDAQDIAQEAFEATLRQVRGRILGWAGNVLAAFGSGIKCPDIAEMFQEHALRLAGERGFSNIVVGGIASADVPISVFGLPWPGSSALHVVPWVSIESMHEEEVVVADPWAGGTTNTRVSHSFYGAGSTPYSQAISGAVGIPPWTAWGILKRGEPCPSSVCASDDTSELALGSQREVLVASNDLGDVSLFGISASGAGPVTASVGDTAAGPSVVLDSSIPSPLPDSPLLIAYGYLDPAVEAFPGSRAAQIRVDVTCPIPAGDMESEDYCGCSGGRSWEGGECVCPEGEEWNAAAEMCDTEESGGGGETTCENGMYFACTPPLVRNFGRDWTAEECRELCEEELAGDDGCWVLAIGQGADGNCYCRGGEVVTEPVHEDDELAPAGTCVGS